MFARSLAPAAVLLAFATAGCALPPATTADGAASAEAETPVQHLDPTTVVAYTQADLVAEFERARSFLLVDKHTEAARAFDRLRRLSTDARIAAPSAFNAGIAYEALGERETAAARYREVVDRYPGASVRDGSLLHLTRVLGYLERWPELGAAADQLLERESELAALDRVEAFGAKALSLVEQGQVDEASRWIGRAQDVIEQGRFGEVGKPPVQLALVSFALGEVRRIRSEQITLLPVTADFIRVLERRCSGLLDAQSAYQDAMRSHDPFWAAMSGYRVGQLYRQLHKEAMELPAPANFSLDEDRQLFEAALRLRYRILLEKGLGMMASIVRMGERTGERSPWVERAEQAHLELERALADEKAALDRLPFSEAEVKAALDRLTGKTPAPRS